MFERLVAGVIVDEQGRHFAAIRDVLTNRAMWLCGTEHVTSKQARTCADMQLVIVAKVREWAP